MQHFDRLVVGGGPAGLGASLALTRAGFNTLLVDPHEYFNWNATCAEGITKWVVPFLPFRLPQSLISHEVLGPHLYYRDCQVAFKGGEWAAYSINRPAFQQWMGEKALKKGLNVEFQTRVKSFAFSSGFRNVRAHLTHHDGRHSEVRADKVILATGASPDVHAWFEGKLNIRSKYAHIHMAEVAGFTGDEKHEHQYFGSFAPQGYGFIYPKGNGLVNFGVGSESASGTTNFNAFRKLTAKKFDKFRVIKDKYGKALMWRKGLPERFGDFQAIGDALAFNVKPYVEGIVPAVITGYYGVTPQGRKTAHYVKFRQMIDLGLSLQDKVNQILKLPAPARYVAFFAFAAGLELPNNTIAELRKAVHHRNLSLALKPAVM